MMNEKTSALSQADILAILPHRYPFLLVDRVLSVSEGPKAGSRVGRRIKAVKQVTFNEPFFQGHFPGNPVMPGVLIIEAMAQAGALAYIKPEDPKSDLAIAHVRSAKFRKPVVPGDSLVLEGQVLKDRGHMILVELKGYVEGELVAEAEILAFISKKVES